MIFIAVVFPSAIALALFWSVVRLWPDAPKPKPLKATSRAERDEVAAETRRWRVGVAVIAVALPTLTVAALHVIHEAPRTWRPQELK